MHRSGLVAFLLLFVAIQDGHAVASAIIEIDPQHPSAESSLTVFEIHGPSLFQASYSSMILGTIGDRPSDNSIHGGGFGSVASSIGASKFNAWQQGQQAYYNAINKLSTVYNPVSSAYMSSLSPAGEIVGQLTNSVIHSTQSQGAATAATTGSPSFAGPTAADVTFTGGLPASFPLYQPNHVDPAAYIRDPYLGIGSTVGLSGVDAYSAAANIVGPPFANPNDQAAGPFGGPFFAGIDSASASSIASRIDGVPQSIAGGEITGINGQSVSVWAEAPDFTRMI